MNNKKTLRTPKIMLLLPPSRAHYVVPPIGLGYLATSLKKYGFFDISIIDGQKENLTRSILEDRLRRDRPDIIGIQVFSSGFTTTQRAMRIIREILPESVIIVGGPHVTATSERVLDDLPEADYGFCGEGEPGLPLLISHLFGYEECNLTAIPGLIFRLDGKIHMNERAIVEDLDNLGFPDWENMPPNTYPDSPQGAFYRHFPIAPILTTRGCPYNCTFCGSPVNMTRHYRARTISHVLDEIEMLYHRYGVREIHIIDDMFSLQKERVMEFCDGLQQRRLMVSYTFPNGLRLDSLDRHLLTRMKQTGAYAFTVGIESGSERILQLMKKQLTLSQIREKIELIRECGLEPSGFFIIGFPGETRQDIETTINFAKSLPIKRAHFSNYLPLPGTESTNALYQAGEVQPGNWDALTYYDIPYAPQGLNKPELKKLQQKAFLSFHLRPRIIWKMLSEIRSVNHLRSILLRARDYLFQPDQKKENFLI